MAKIHIENGIISSSADYSLYHGTSPLATVEAGGLRVQGDIIAENMIVSSSTTYMTTSFSAGSTAFGDTLDDTHQFTGSLLVTGSNIEMHSDADTKLRVRRNQHATAALELSYRGSTGPLIHSVGKELDISTDTSGISLLPASGIVSINDNSSQGVKPGALSIQKISGINYLAIASAASSGTEGNIFLITGSNGNVGIANQDPQEKLDVTGNIQASGNISGSSTSTGSFGRGKIAGNLQVDGGQGTGVIIGPKGAGSADDRKLTIVGYDEPMIEFETHGGWGRQRIQGHYNGSLLIYNSGSIETDIDLNIGQLLTGGKRKGSIHIATEQMSAIQMSTAGYATAQYGTITGSNHYSGDAVISARFSSGGSDFHRLHFTKGNVLSGSATSTGSFADGRFVGKVAIGTTSSPTTDLAIGGASYTGGGLYVAAGSSNRVALLGNIEFTTGTGGSWSGQSINAQGGNRTLRFKAGGNLNASDSSIFVFNGVQGNARTVDQNTFEIVGGYGNATLKADYSFMKIGGTVNQTNAAQSGSVIGIEYDPSFTASPTGSHTAFLATSGDIVSRGTNAVISGSITSTGSFGRVEGTKLAAGTSVLTTNSLSIQTTSRFFGVSGNSINMTANGSSITSGAYNIIVGRLNIGHTYSTIDFGRINSNSTVSKFRVQHHVSDSGNNPWGILNPQYETLSMFDNSGSLFLNYGDVSGSSTSTGSFGSLTVDGLGHFDRLAVGGADDTNIFSFNRFTVTSNGNAESSDSILRLEDTAAKPKITLTDATNFDAVIMAEIESTLAASKMHFYLGNSTNDKNDHITLLGDGKVGIGTTEPANTFHSYGSTGIRVETNHQSTAAQLIFKSPAGSSNGGDAGGQINVYDSTGAARVQHTLRRVSSAANGDSVGDYPLEWWTSNADGGLNFRMKLNRTGLGIGTQNPLEKLHVEGKAYIRRTGTATAHGDTDLFVADSTAGGSTAQIQILGGASGQSFLYFSDTDSYAVGGIKYYHSDNKMNFRVNETDILDITSTKISGSASSTGSFGVVTVGVGEFGTSIADSVPIGLQVANSENSKIRLARNTSLGNYLDIVGGTGGGIYNVNTSGTQAHIFKLANSEIARIDSSGVSGSNTSTGSFGSVVAGGTGLNTFTGGVGIGTTNPGAKLEVYTTGAGLKVQAAGTSPFTQTIAEFRYLGNGNSITVQNIFGAAALNATSTMQLASAGTVRLTMNATNSTFTNNIVTSGNVSGSSTSTGSFGDGRIAGRLGIQTTTPRGPIDVKGSLGSQGFYLSDSGGAVKLPTDIGHSSGAGTFDFQVENFRLGRNGYGVVSVYPRFNSMLQLGTQDDTNLLTLSGSTQISGSLYSTGSFGTLRSANRLTIDVPTWSGGSTTKGIIDINEPHQSGGDAFLMTYNNANSDFYLMSDQGRMVFYSSPAPAYDGTGQGAFRFQADMDDDGAYLMVGNSNLTNVPLIVRPNMISGSAQTTGSFAKGFIADGLTIGGDNTFVDSKLNVTDGHIRLDNLKKLHWAGTNNGIRGTSSGYLEFITGNQVRQKVGSGTTTHYQNVRLTDTINFGSETYTTGFGGEGYRIGLDSANRYEAEFDNLFVRGRMTVFELLINQIRASNGAVYVSDAAKVESVTSVNATTFHLNFDTGSGYGHPFQQDDLLKAQRFNGSGVYLSRMTVTGIAGTNGLTASLFTGDTPPSGGFEFVRVGSTSDTDRQGAIYLTNSDNGAPFMDVYDGVDSHVFPTGSEYLKVRVGKLDGVSSPTLTIPSSTYGFYASGSAFLEGTINATAGGFIGGWNINASTIEKVNSNGGVRLDSSNKRIDFLSNASTTRLRVGQVDSNKFGIRGFNTAGNRVFEISEVRNEIAGWSIQETVISSSDGNVQIDAGNSRFLIKSGTAERVRMGLLNDSSQYGISGSDENGNLLFKLGDAGNEIAGWEIAQGLLRYDNASGSIALDASNQNISIHTGSINTAKPKVVMGNLPTTGGQRYGFAVFSGSANADINNDDTYSVLITRDKARLAGWDLVPGRLKSGTVADINGNKASIALGGGSGGTNALNAGATPTSNLFFVSASSNPIFYVGENFSYVNDTLTAAGWTLNSDGFSDASDNIQLSSTHASMSLGQKVLIEGGTNSTIRGGAHFVSLAAFDNDQSGFVLGQQGNNTIFEVNDGGSNFIIFDSGAGTPLKIQSSNFTLGSTNFKLTNTFLKLGTIDNVSDYSSTERGFYVDSSGNVLIKGSVANNNYIRFNGTSIQIKSNHLELAATNLTASSDDQFLHLGPATRVDGDNWESSTGAFFSGSGEFRIASGSNSIQYSKANNAVTMNFDNFSVDAQGKINATDGTFSGDISATSGFFGNTAGLGWVIDGNTIKNASGSIFLNANPAQTSIGVSNTGGAFIGEIVPDYSPTSDIFSSGTAYIDTSIPTTAVTIGSDALGGMTRTASTDLFIYYTNATTAVVGTSLGNEADLTVGVNYRATVVIEVTIFVNTPNYAQSNYTLLGNAQVGGTLNFRKQSIDLVSVSLDRTIIGDSFGSGTTLRSFTYTKTIIHDFEASATAEYNAEVLDFSVTNNGIQERYTTFIGEGKPPVVSTIDTTVDATSKVVYTDFTLQPSSKKTQMAPGGFQTVNMGSSTLENSSNTYFRTDVEQGQAFNAMGTGHFTGSFSLKPLGGGANNKISISGREITIHEVDSTTQSGLAFLHGSNTFRPIVTIEHPTITTDRFNAVLALKRGDTAKDRAHIQFWKGNTFEWACGTAYNGGSVTDEFHISQHDAESNGAYSAGTSALRIDTNDMTHLINLSIYNTNNSTEEAARFVSAGPASTIPVVSIAQQEGDGAMVNGTILLDLDYTNDSSIGSNNDYIRFQDGFGEVGRIHSEVSYGTFTGAHISQRPSGSNFSNWKKGMLLKSTGNILVTGSMSKAWPEVDLVTTQKDKAIMGVFVETGSAPADNPKYDEMVASGSRHTGVISGFNPTLPSINYNALGEGLIRVTDTNGNIETGDYICSSNRTGHGEKQDDDLLHNYTVAKATQPIDFSNVSVDSDLGYKSVLIACTYHCG